MKQKTRVIHKSGDLDSVYGWLCSLVDKTILDGPIEISVSKFSRKRSLSQNRLLWMWNNCIQIHMRDHYGQIAKTEDWHEVLVERLCPAKTKIVKLPTGEQITVGRTRTSAMTTREMSEYLNLLECYCAEHLQLVLPRPDDMYWKAILEDDKQ